MSSETYRCTYCGHENSSQVGSTCSWCGSNWGFEKVPVNTSPVFSLPTKEELPRFEQWEWP